MTGFRWRFALNFQCLEIKSLACVGEGLISMSTRL